MTDTIIFIVGAFVTILWGSMVGLLLYAVNTPINRSNSSPIDVTDKN